MGFKEKILALGITAVVIYDTAAAIFVDRPESPFGEKILVTAVAMFITGLMAYFFAKNLGQPNTK